ncbi:prepilin-type N-terminal cleavage/methylation domain-containing protein [Dongshaea marina]|uniref:prepilin-type N-terminal cleavage/methylation domain-containing protein n=1 Tax=Dongshaea marina TaxID=2047966 RepID=UPI000D3E9674|nr:prepilin-type N-terminal cleavage/methylation domain-containing protein [Dongshaea marina]
MPINRSDGFTLIELIVIIVIIGILAAVAVPRFVSLSDDASASVVSGTAGAFSGGINLAHSKWIAGGYTGPVDNLQVYSGGADGQLDMNASGWPAQSYPPFEANPTLNNVDDCQTVWETILSGNSPKVAADGSEEYTAVYLGTGRCRYELTANTNLSFSYDSNTGEVSIDADPDS